MNCRIVGQAAMNRPVSLGSLSREFNDLVHVDHYNLDEDVLHVKDVAARYSSGYVLSSPSLSKAIELFEGYRLTPFWPPAEIQADKAFDKEELLQYLKNTESVTRFSLLMRQSKNETESKHRII